MVKLKYRLTKEEYFQFNFYTAWASPDRRRYRLAHYGRIFLLYAAVAVLYIIARRSDRMLFDFTVFAIIGLVYFLLVPTLVRKSIRRRVNQILQKPENAHILEEAEVTLRNDGITDRDALSESRYEWEAIVRKAETPDSYYLYTNSYHAIVIPKRILKPEEQAELLRLLNQYLPLSSEFGSG